jgi:hypothetical protein
MIIGQDRTLFKQKPMQGHTHTILLADFFRFYQLTIYMGVNIQVRLLHILSPIASPYLLYAMYII